MTRAEFLRWLEFHRRNPIDPNAQLRALAMVAHTVASKDNKNPPELSRFVEFVIPPVEEDLIESDEREWQAFINSIPAA